MTAKRLIFAQDHLFDDVQKLYREGMQRGNSTGWSSLDAYLSIASQQMTVVTGIPGSGKSEWLDALMVNLAINHGWRFAVYSPENHPVALHVSKLVEKYVGAPFRKGPTRRMDAEAAQEATLWVLEHFIFLDPEYRDLQSLMDAAMHFRTIGNFGVVLDPWNCLEHFQPAGMTDAAYISDALRKLAQWARTADLHLWVVAHPAKLYKDQSTGKRAIPTPYDIAGSAAWYNRADNVVTIHRDQAQGDELVQIWVQKVRFKHIGKVGGVELIYDRVTGRYADKPRSDAPAGRLPYVDAA